MYNTYDSTYTTYERVNEQLKGSTQNVDLTSDKSIIQQYIRVASREITEFCKRTFVPYINTHYHYLDISKWWVLELPDDCMVLNSITDTTDTVIDSTFYRLRDVYNELNARPYRYVEFSRDSNLYVSYTANYFTPTFTFNGIWGFNHRDYSSNWVSTTTLDADINDSVTTISVTSASDFEELEYIRVNSEFMQITGIDTDNNNLTVERAVNGSTAMAHTNGDTVEVWQVERAIQEATTRYVVYMYNSRQGTGNTIVFQDGTIASQYPALVWANLMRYQRPVFRSV